METSLTAPETGLRPAPLQDFDTHWDGDWDDFAALADAATGAESRTLYALAVRVGVYWRCPAGHANYRTEAVCNGLAADGAGECGAARPARPPYLEGDR